MPTVVISESADKTLKELVRTSGLSQEDVLERALAEYSGRDAAQHADPQFAPPPDGGNSPQIGPRTMSSATNCITKTPGVCGGSACIRGTRITVWGLEAYRRFGAPDRDILRAVQGLTPEDLRAAFDYAAANREEIDRDIRENEEGEASLAG